MDIWYDKYNKYKNKYLNLKNKSLSGGIDNNIDYYERLEKKDNIIGYSEEREKQEERERIRQEERERIRQEERESANRGKPPQHKIIKKTPPNPQNPFNQSNIDRKSTRLNSSHT